MLSERQLEALLEVFQARTQAVTEEYLTRMGEHLRDIGRLGATDVHRLIQLKRMKANMKTVKRELARILGVMDKDIEDVFRQIARSDERFARELYASDHAPTVKYRPGSGALSTSLERTLKAQVRITQQEMWNLSQTTLDSTLYRRAVDVAVQTVQTGMTDYSSAIRKAMKQAAVEGLRVVYPNSGMTRRLDTAVRQNVLDGMRALNQDALDQLGKEFGADGVEISAHDMCAEDHLPYQGRQYAKRDFERIQNSLKRPFGKWNCKHTTYPIIMGVTEPAHTQAELAGYWQRSTEMLTIDGHTRTRYQWTQQMRRIESAIRGQKDIAVAAKAAGDMTARREAQKHINALQEAYNRIAEAAELAKRTDLMTVSGFRAVKAAETLKRSVKSDIIQVAGQTINTRIKAQKQQEHIWGSKAFVQRTEAAKKSGRSLPSAFYQDVDVEKLVKANMGKGEAQKNQQGVLSEYFDADKNVGWVYLSGLGAYETTSRVCIRYSKKGWHAFPVKQPQEE